MPRRPTLSTHLLAQVRAWFGLNQAELALYLSSSKALVQAIESGQRRLGADLHATLLPLARHLPAPAPEALPTLLPLPAAEAKEVDFRRRTCQQQAARLGQELAGLEQQARVAQRWAQALPALLPAAAAGPDPERAAWLRGWLLRRASPLSPEAATRLRLLRARLAGLHAELAALAGTAESYSNF